MMRLCPVIILVCALCLVAGAQEEARSPQVAAATADAIDGLHREVLGADLSPGVTVKDLVDRVGGTQELSKTLHAARLVGGTRWLDDQTAQVQLVTGGGDVAKVLTALVRQNPGKSPIPPDQLERQLAGWSDRTFSALGTSTSAADIERLRPPAGDRAWWGVSDAARKAALSSARDNAINRVIDSLRPIQFDTGHSLDQALSVPQVRDTVRNWLTSRPVKSVEFDDDLSVHLALLAQPEDLWHATKSALAQQTQVPVATGQAAWDRLQEQVVARAAPAVGVGLAQAGKGVAPDKLIPSDPPDWSARQTDAEATSPAHGSKLHTARAAEALAMEKLRSQINALPLGPKATVGDAARSDPRIEEAVSRALGRARPYKVDYGAKGAVTVHVSLNLANLWSELANQQ
jgi:hypothetical protein